jgi:glutamate-1-semialdehyde 2,1-aminomutase
MDSVGLNLGAHTLAEVRLASLLCQRFPAIEQIRFCNSGTEANLYALSVARMTTGKQKVVVFEGGYHGGLLSFGHGISGNVVDRDDWLLTPYHDGNALEALLDNHADEVAAIIVEPMQGAGGCLPATQEFLRKTQSLAATVSQSTHSFVTVLTNS